MRINSLAGTQRGTFDGGKAGEGLSIFFSQQATDDVRYRFLISAITDQGTMQVGEFFSSPPNATDPIGQLTRMLAGAVCPGANSWAVDVSAVEQEEANPEEVAELILSSSRCCTAPIGVTRVGERYIYIAGDSLGGGTNGIPVAAGRTISSWGALASAGTDGSVTVGAGPTILVPAGFSVNSQPKVPLTGNTVIAFFNVAYFLELLESA